MWQQDPADLLLGSFSIDRDSGQNPLLVRTVLDSESTCCNDRLLIQVQNRRSK